MTTQLTINTALIAEGNLDIPIDSLVEVEILANLSQNNTCLPCKIINYKSIADKDAGEKAIRIKGLKYIQKRPIGDNFLKVDISLADFTFTTENVDGVEQLTTASRDSYIAAIKQVC